MTPLPPGSTIGILGSGQLGRMLAIAAAEMGYHTHIYSPDMDAPAYEVAKRFTVSSYTNAEALERFAGSVDVVTYEFENIETTALATIPSLHKILPGIDVLRATQHRVLEKQTLHKLGVATAPFVAVKSLDDLRAATIKLGFPCVVKTCRMGYDGKGQAMLKSAGDVESAWKVLDTDDAILEGFVKFRMEISVVVARGMNGEIKCFAPVQNIHKHHILSETIAPAPISAALSAKAEAMATAIAKGMNLVGLMAVEMFVTTDDEILVNELAPRPHNSGHWTIDACVTSQFEQTIRAICGLPLGSVERLCDARMLNLIDDDVKDWQKYASQPNAKLHLYGKKESRPGRKMGHVTFIDD